MQTFAILGSHPDLSIAEIKAITGSSPALVAGIGAIFEDLNGNPDRLMLTLGGTQKIGHVIGELPGHATEDLVAFLASQIEHEYGERKAHFGISVYDFGDASAVNKLAVQMRQVGMTVKTQLKERGVSARFVMAKEPALNAVAVLKNDLTRKGAEFVLLVAKDRIVIGTTAAVQNAEDWSQRDFDRPRRNAKQGMLPPKLARMMINLTGNSDLAKKTLLDPFCGSGTVLMEGAMLGAQKVIGGDVAANAVNDTRSNMNWLKPRLETMPELETYTAQAAEIAKSIPPNSIDLIVTETYLGRPRRGNESLAEIKETIDYVTNLYKESFGPMRNTLKGGGSVVIAAPIHFSEGKTFEPPVEEIFTELGYTPQPFEKPLVYKREGQLVGRVFYRFIAS